MELVSKMKDIINVNMTSSLLITIRRCFIVCLLIVPFVVVLYHHHLAGGTINVRAARPRIPSTTRVLVTGAAGFIGHHITVELQRRGLYAVGLDNFNTYYNVTLKRQRANMSKVVVDGNVCNSSLVASLIRDHRITHVIHMAAQAGVRYSLDHPQEYVRNNVACFVNLLQTLQGKSIPLIYASSSSVYGNNTKVPFAEHDHVDTPMSLYAATKREDELLAHVYWNLYRQRSIGLRFFTVYGPMGRPDMAYFSFTKNILEGKPLTVFNHGKLSRDFTYITDIVDGVVSCLGITYEHEILNLGRGEPQQLMDFIRSIERATGEDAVLEYVDMAKGDVLTTYADVSAARGLLGYSPRVGMEEGIANFVKWYRTSVT